LREECAVAFSEYLTKKEDLAQASKKDKWFVTRRRRFDEARGRWRESSRRETQHRSEFHGVSSDLSVEEKLARARESLESGDAELLRDAIFDLSPINNGWIAVPDDVVEGLLALLQDDDLNASELPAHILNYFEFESPRMKTHHKRQVIQFLKDHG